jgi:outer membrane translocation and assembly module TamA
MDEAWKRQDERRRKEGDKDKLEETNKEYLRQPEMFNAILAHQESHNDEDGTLKIRAMVYEDKAPVMEVYCTYYDTDKERFCGWWSHFVNGEMV